MTGQWCTEGPSRTERSCGEEKQPGTSQIPSKCSIPLFFLRSSLEKKQIIFQVVATPVKVRWAHVFMWYLSFLILGRTETCSKVSAMCSGALYIWGQHLRVVLFPLTKFCIINHCTPYRCIEETRKIKPSKRLCTSSVAQQTALRRHIHYFTFFLLQLAELLVSEAELTLFTIHCYRC